MLEFLSKPLPVLNALEDCSDYSKTVEPFIPQLYEVPSQLLNNVGNLKQLYIDTNPLIAGFAASILFGGIFLVVSEFNRNYSQVDRMWSILPNLYVVHIAVWARLAGLPHQRIDLIALFTSLWSIRLTFNYWRKGGYEKGSEDYRWDILQKNVPKFIWFLFNATFISFIQSVLLFAFSCPPAYAILLSTKYDQEITKADIAYFVSGVALVVSQFISDGQQWTYHNAKHHYQKTGQVTGGYKKADLDRGFNTSGIWAYSRHPNFIAEQSIWFVLYQWSCYATNSLYSWTGIGAGCLVLLFQGSTWLTEMITAGKYPEYHHYQNQVGMFMPQSFKGYAPPDLQQKGTRTSDFENKKQK